MNLGGNVVLRLAISVLFVAPGGNRGPVRQGGAEVAGHHARVQQLDDRRERHAARGLVLVDAGAPGDGVVHELLERAGPDDPDLERPDRPVHRPAPPVHRVQGLLHLQAAPVEGLLAHRLVAGGQQLPVDDVVPRDAPGPRRAAARPRRSCPG